jgi:hypothetical protein
MESRGCPVALKKTPTLAQIALLAQLPQIPHFITSTQSLGNHMIDVHWAIRSSTLHAATIALEYSFSGFAPSS